MNRLEYLAHPPLIHPIRKIITPEVNDYIASQYIPVYEVRKKDCGVVLLEIVFQAGRPQEASKMIASSTAAMLREGAGKFSSADLSEEVDYMGATLSTSASMDFITIKGVCLRKHLASLVQIMKAVVSDPHFNDAEWSHYKDKSKERLKVQLAKPDILSYRTITETLYGGDHPYGYNSSADLYDGITPEHLRAHHEAYNTAQNCQIFISGDIGDEDRGLIEGLCSQLRSGGALGDKGPILRSMKLPSRVVLKGGSGHQASLRLARLGLTRKNSDFDALNYVCNILGGYFGSRLMTNLREDKGLTYSIYCTMDSQLYDGDIMVSTEVANENVHQCLEAIYNEMEILCTDLVSDEELALVNNYMMGNYLNLFDGPFNSIRAIKSLALAQIPLDELDTLIKSSLTFDAYQVRDMARKYFDRNDFWEVIVGTPQE